MVTSNHSSKHHRIYWLTDPGKRLATYLNYCAWQPTLDSSILFADLSVPPEHHDDDHEETTLERLYRELQQALDDQKSAGWRDEAAAFEARERYFAIKNQIYDIENPPTDADIQRAKDEADRLIQKHDDERDDLLSYDPDDNSYDGYDGDYSDRNTDDEPEED